MKKLRVNLLNRTLAAFIGGLLLAAAPLQAAPITIINAGLEDPAMDDVLNTSFSGLYGINTGVPGWFSNEEHTGGAIRVDAWYPGRTGNNVMYLHGTGDQNFYTAGFDLGVDLQSHTKYTLSFDVLRWAGITADDYVIFRAGIYTGATYEERSALAELSGDFYLLDDASNPVDVKTVTLTFTTGDVELGTKFWIGGDAFGSALDMHRTHFDNFALEAEAIPEPSSLVLGILGIGALGRRVLRCRAKSGKLRA